MFVGCLQSEMITSPPVLSSPIATSTSPVACRGVQACGWARICLTVIWLLRKNNFVFSNQQVVKN